MATNSLLTISEITREAIVVLHEEIQLAKHAVRKFQERFGKSSGQIGTSVQIRKPPRYSVVNGTVDVTSSIENSVEDYAMLNCAYNSPTGGRSIIPMQFSTEDLTLKINDFSKQFIRPAVARLARDIDIRGFNMLKVSPNYRYSRTVTGAITFLDYTNLGAYMTSQLAPEGDRKLFVDPIDTAAIVDQVKGLFQSATQIADQYEKGYMGESGGFTWVATNNLPTIIFPSNPASSIGVVSAGYTPAEGDTTIQVTGYTASSKLMAGQGFTIAGVYAIDPETQAQLPYLATFVNTADVTFGATNSVAVVINVARANYTTATSTTQAWLSALPAQSAATALTELGTLTSKAGKMAFGIHKDALALGVIELEVPGGVDMGAAESFEGIGLRITRQWNSLTDQWVCRVETQYGWSVLRPELITSSMGYVR